MIALLNRLCAIIANSLHNIRSVLQERGCSKFVHSGKVQPPTFSFWLAADRCYSVMTSGRAGSN